MITNAQKQFRQDLMTRRAKPHQKASLSEILELLKLIQMMLMNEKPGSASSVNFVVTERDENGKIKSFKVES